MDAVPWASGAPSLLRAGEGVCTLPPALAVHSWGSACAPLRVTLWGRSPEPWPGFAPPVRPGTGQRAQPVSGAWF